MGDVGTFLWVLGGVVAVVVGISWWYLRRLRIVHLDPKTGIATLNRAPRTGEKLTVRYQYQDVVSGGCPVCKAAPGDRCVEWLHS